MSDSGPASTALGFLIGLLMLAVYFIPCIIAFQRDHHQKAAIMITNIFGGLFCGLGWIVALVWSLTARAEHQNGTLLH